ncbi:MAG: hypothetical protein LDLANPLL_00193 [Turneriella sp.]|nr:hypothetical protein [Turneriella sp.]
MLLLDTCTLLWLVQDYTQLPLKVQNLIQKRSSSIFVSSISAFEIGIKYAKGKLKLPLKPDAWFEEALEFHGIQEIPADSKIMLSSTQLPPHHNDPADRIIVATAKIHACTILTPDTLIKKYKNIKVVW